LSSSKSRPSAVQFSPDGTRIAYLHTVAAKPRLATIGFDGSGKRDLAPFQSVGAGGLDPDAGLTVGVFGMTMLGGLFLGQLQPRRKDATHVGWVTCVGSTADSGARDEWELYVAEDRDGAAPSCAS
jgi:hypothetical protein